MSERPIVVMTWPSLIIWAVLGLGSAFMLGCIVTFIAAAISFYPGR